MITTYRVAYFRPKRISADSRSMGIWCLGAVLCLWTLYSLVGPSGVWAAMQKRERLKNLQEDHSALAVKIEEMRTRVQGLEKSAEILRKQKGKKAPNLPNLEIEIRRGTDAVRQEEKVFKTPEPPAQPPSSVEGKN